MALKATASVAKPSFHANTYFVKNKYFQRAPLPVTFRKMPPIHKTPLKPLKPLTPSK